MKRLTENLIGKTIKCGEEWYSGYVYYVDIYKDKEDRYKAKRKIYLNTYTNKIDKERHDAEVFVPFGFEVDELGFIS